MDPSGRNNYRGRRHTLLSVIYSKEKKIVGKEVNPMQGVITELNKEIQALNESGRVPYISLPLVLGMLQNTAEATLNTSSEELPLTKEERSHVFAGILAITKALTHRALNDEQDGLIIWVPRSECVLNNPIDNEPDGSW